MRARKQAATVNLNLRLPKDVHRRLAQEAKKPGGSGSLNSEIIARLVHSFERDDADAVLTLAHTQRQGMFSLYSIVAEKLDLPRVPGLLAPQEEVDAYFAKVAETKKKGSKK